MIGWNLQISNNRKVVRNQIRGRNRENVASSRRTNHTVEKMTVNVGRKVNVLMEVKRVKIPDSRPASDDEESIERLKSQIRARS